MSETKTLSELAVPGHRCDLCGRYGCHETCNPRYYYRRRSPSEKPDVDSYGDCESLIISYRDVFEDDIISEGGFQTKTLYREESFWSKNDNFKALDISQINWWSYIYVPPAKEVK